MKSLAFLKSGSSALIVACAALAPFVVGQAGAAPASGKAGGEQAPVWRTMSSEANTEVGTIPAARQGLPQQNPRGAEGPIRSDSRAQGGNPSIRDSNPLTVNGLWETMPGNVVSRPHVQ